MQIQQKIHFTTLETLETIRQVNNRITNIFQQKNIICKNLQKSNTFQYHTILPCYTTKLKVSKVKNTKIKRKTELEVIHD